MNDLASGLCGGGDNMASHWLSSLFPSTQANNSFYKALAKIGPMAQQELICLKAQKQHRP
jgi:hypothetical protein